MREVIRHPSHEEGGGAAQGECPLATDSQPDALAHASIDRNSVTASGQSAETPRSGGTAPSQRDPNREPSSRPPWYSRAFAGTVKATWQKILSPLAHLLVKKPIVEAEPASTETKKPGVLRRIFHSVASVSMSGLRATAPYIMRICQPMMEGLNPMAMFKVANATDNKHGAKLGYPLVLTGYVGGTAASLMTFGVGLGGVSMAVMFAPMIAWGATRINSAIFSVPRAGKQGLLARFARAAERVAEESPAFSHRTVKKKENGVLTREEKLQPVPASTRKFLVARLQERCGEVGLEGLVNYTLSRGHRRQSELGREVLISKSALVDTGLKNFESYESAPAAHLFYPNGELTVAGNRFLRRVIEENGGKEYHQSVERGEQDRYLTTASRLLGLQILGKLGQTTAAEIRLDPDTEQSMRASIGGPESQSDPYSLPDLRRSDYKAGPSKFLIDAGRFIGGVPMMSPVGAGIALLGSVVNSGGKLLHKDKERGLLIASELNILVDEFDKAFNESDDAFTGVRAFVDGGVATINSIEERVGGAVQELVENGLLEILIAHTPLVAQVETERVSQVADVRYESEEAPLEAPDRRGKQTQDAEEFLRDFWTKVVESDTGKAADQITWRDHLATMRRKPAELVTALQEATEDMTNEDKEVVQGLRIYFGEQARAGVRSVFDRVSGVLKWLRPEKNNTESDKSDRA